MKSVSLSHAKAHLSGLVRRVARGEVIVILSRGRPVARLSAPQEADLGSDAERLEQLEKEGVITRARKPPSLQFLEMPVPTVEADLLGALLEEREEGR
jgi:antitoxin (DNA-binding transcriptional repressor) of toxin-antitoxin stability system